MSVDELDAMLEGIRARRLERVHRLEAIAKVKADDAQLVSFMQFERAYGIAARYMRKFEEMEKKAEQLIHKVRLRAMQVQFEVEETNDAAD
jgi:hypothetical protein